MCVLSCLSHMQLFVTPWTVAHQAPLSMGFSRQEYWSRFPFPGDLPNPGIGPMSTAAPALQVDSLPLRPQGTCNQCLKNINEVFCILFIISF